MGRGREIKGAMIPIRPGSCAAASAKNSTAPHITDYLASQWTSLRAGRIDAPNSDSLN